MHNSFVKCCQILAILLIEFYIFSFTQSCLRERKIYKQKTFYQKSLNNHARIINLELLLLTPQLFQRADNLYTFCERCGELGSDVLMTTALLSLPPRLAPAYRVILPTIFGPNAYTEVCVFISEIEYLCAPLFSVLPVDKIGTESSLGFTDNQSPRLSPITIQYLSASILCEALLSIYHNRSLIYSTPYPITEGGRKGNNIIESKPFYQIRAGNK